MAAHTIDIGNESIGISSHTAGREESFDHYQAGSPVYIQPNVRSSSHDEPIYSAVESGGSSEGRSARPSASDGSVSSHHRASSSSHDAIIPSSSSLSLSASAEVPSYDGAVCVGLQSCKFETPKERMLGIVLPLCQVFMAGDTHDMMKSIEEMCLTIQKESSFGPLEERDITYVLTKSDNMFVSFRLEDLIAMHPDTSLPYWDIVDSIVGNCTRYEPVSHVHIFENYDLTFFAVCYNRLSNMFLMIDSNAANATEAGRCSINVDVMEPGEHVNRVFAEWKTMIPLTKTFMILTFDEFFHY